MLPAGALVFAAHIVQTLEDVAFWYVSIGQSTHAEEPDAPAYVPVGQLSHSSDPMMLLLFPGAHAAQPADPSPM